MNRFLIILFSLLVRIVAVAQPVPAANSLGRSANNPMATETSPERIKATESPFYIKVYGLYGFLTPGVQILHSDLLGQSGAIFTFKTINKGLGTGPRAGIGLGFIVSDFINLGVDADVLFGSALKTNNSFGDGLGTSTTSTTITLKVLSVMPNITFKALSRPTYYIYNRLGLAGGIVLDYKQVDSGIDLSKAGVTTSSSEQISNYTKNSLALGYQVALGVQFRLSQNLRGFAEAVAYNQSFKPGKLEQTSTFINSGGVTTRVRTTEFTDQGNLVGASSTKTGQQQAFNVPMNSVGVGVGLSFRF